jgi:hypothetical protein
VFVARATRDIAIRADGEAVALASEKSISGGALLTLNVPDDARWLTASGEGRSLLRKRLLRARPAPEALAKARELRDARKLDEASALAESVAKTSDEVLRARAYRLLARIALSRGAPEAIDAAFELAMRQDEQASLASELVDDACAWAFSLIFRARFTEARTVLARAADASDVYADGKARLEYYAGVLGTELGHTRPGLAHLREASRLADRLGLRELARSARQQAAVRSIALGRSREALDQLVAIFEREDQTMSGCERADLAQNIGWLSLHVDGAPHGSPTDWVERALALYRDSCPAHNSPEWTMPALTNRARAALRRGDLSGARAALRIARETVPHPPAMMEIEWLEIEGQLDVTSGKARDAVAPFNAMADRAASIDARDSQRLALELKAAALSNQGKKNAALEALEAASKLVDAQALEIPIGEGREGYLRSGEDDDSRAIELLISLGRPNEALGRLRRAHARLLSGLIRSDRLDTLEPNLSVAWENAVGAYRRERDSIDNDASEDWRFAASTLADRTRARAERAANARRALEAALAEIVGEPHPAAPRAAPPEGETVLALYAGAKQWIGFVAEGDRVRAQVVDPDPTHLLAPFAPEIRRAKRLAVVTFGDARKLDVHALPFDGAPLIARVPVVYPLDAPHVARDGGTPRGALVVGDPTSDLPSARSEATEVNTALSATRTVTLLRGDDARGDAVRGALAEASLFHYAGHGIFAGRDGWESALPLAEHGQLAISDILALPRVPATVVLGGCETARASGEAQAEGLGVAQAFVVAGAESVVAATRVVDDDAAAAMARALYAHLGAGDDVPEALRQAQRELDATGVKDWAAFRVLVP